MGSMSSYRLKSALQRYCTIDEPAGDSRGLAAQPSEIGEWGSASPSRKREIFSLLAGKNAGACKKSVSLDARGVSLHETQHQNRRSAPLFPTPVAKILPPAMS